MSSHQAVLPPGKPQRLPVTSLRLDPENPRLPESRRARTQDELIKLLADDYSLSELGRSLAGNGYFSEEPLAAIKPRPSRDEYTVIEGNRRAAALKLLTDAALRARLKLKEWDELAAQVRFDLSKVPVITYDTREELLTFMGFRHITGVKVWEPLAKARFVHSLVATHRMDFQEAARRVGTRPNAIRQHYIAFRVYLQARDQFGIDVSKVERSYGVFTRAMSSGPLKEHIGITQTKERSESPRTLAKPVPRGKKAALREFISWVVGTKKVKAVISDSREITALGEIVSSPAALKLLRSGGTFEAAKQQTGEEQARLVTHIRTAEFHLDQALKDADRHKKSSLVESALRRCEELMSELRKALK